MEPSGREHPTRPFLLELAALEPATSWRRTRGSDASPALTGHPDYSTSLDAAKRHTGGLQLRRSRWRALDAMRTRNARLVLRNARSSHAG